ncbi:SUKH-4 family immunity protein [Kitasatospora sp. MAP5-34]|uniref:SUKH-4 family immunity protein n=1 Tax=Kitasatospora sp. MAP5-34 TaxID=3035102 RepID=UPI0032AF6171
MTYAQAQELAEDWINAGVPRSRVQTVRVREFDLGFVCWALEPGEGQPAEGATGGGPRLVIARDSGASTLWPPLPVNEVVRRYEETYGTPSVPNPAGAAKPVPSAVEATSFHLTPPKWVQEAGAAAIAAEAARLDGPAPEAPVAVDPVAAAVAAPVAAVAAVAEPAEEAYAPPVRLSTPPASERPAGQAPTMLAPPPDSTPPPFPLPTPAQSFPEAAPAAAPAAPVPAQAPAPAPEQAPAIEHAPTMLASDGSPGLMGLPGAPGPGHAGRGPSAPPPPPPAELRPASGGHHADGAAGRSGPGAPPPPPASLLGGAQPAAPAAAGISYEATQLATAVEYPQPQPQPGPGQPAFPPPPPPGGFQPGAFQPGAYATPGPAPVGYGYPGVASAGAPAPVVPAGPPPMAPMPPVAVPPSGVPSIGPGSVAVVSYRGPDGSEQKLIHRSEPGTPHPEWKALQDLRRLNVPPDQVLELHTDLECCELPGGYCARMVRAAWPNVRLSHTAPYGRDQQARQSGMALLLDHLDQLHQLAAAPQRPRPVRVPLPAPGTVPMLPPVAPQQLAAELGQVFGPGVFRFEQRAVSRQGVPEAVAQTLVWAGLPRDFAPFFWAQAQEGRPIPTLAELAAERGLPQGPDFGGFLVLGNDYGRQLCVQYGTAAVVAVDLEGGGEPPRFVNTGVPEFVRSLAVLGRMWPLRYGLTPDQAGRWTTDFQAQLAAVDPAALQTPETWWAVLLEQFWDGVM